MLSSISKLSSIRKLRPLAALALLPLLAACGRPATPPPPHGGPPVQSRRVAFQPGDASREFVGVVRARHETDLGFRVAGKIMARTVNVGDKVHVGDVVSRVDQTALKH